MHKYKLSLAYLITFNECLQMQVKKGHYLSTLCFSYSFKPYF
jgi:hypothetical protein